jgi:ketosteroid isomerase-like protein
MPAVDHERTIRDYFDACTAGDARAIPSFFAPDAVHYFPDGDTYPDGSPQRTFRGADAIGHGFGDRFGGEFRTRWTVDHVIVGAERREAVIEWSNFKPSVSPDARLRGAEFYRFDAAGKIVEIRAYYACPPGGPGRPSPPVGVAVSTHEPDCEDMHAPAGRARSTPGLSWKDSPQSHFKPRRLRSCGYSVRRASVGESRAARIAGSSPAMAPIAMAAASPPAHASVGMTVVQCLVWA